MYCVDGALDVLRAGISVLRLIEAKAVLPVGLGSNIQVDTRLLPPEQVWRGRKESLFCKLVAGHADVGIHPEHFLQNDNSRSRPGLRSCGIGGERAALSF